MDVTQLKEVTRNNIVRAQIYLHLPKARSSNPADRKVWIETILLDVDKYGKRIEQSIRNDAAELRLGEAGWAAINATEIVDIWLKNPESNFGVEFRVKTKNQAIIPVGIQHQLGRNVSYLFIFSLRKVA